MSEAYDTENLQTALDQLLNRLDHVLPSQAPIRDFVHHNTLHGFQHLPFPEALKQARDLTGAYGYLSHNRFRQYYRTGRICRDDLDTVLAKDASLDCDAIAFSVGDEVITQGDLYRTALIVDLKPITSNQFIWQVEEIRALEKVQPDVHIDARETLLERACFSGLNTEVEAIEDLWNACIQILALDSHLLHPEELMKLTPERITRMLAASGDVGVSGVDDVVQHYAQSLLDDLTGQVGNKLTIRQLLKQLTSVDITHDIQPVLVRSLSAWLDQGMMNWCESEPEEQGFYANWKSTLSLDRSGQLQDLPDWQEYLDALPEGALETIRSELQHLGIPCEHWMDYLERLALELPGWSGMFLWRDRNSDYAGLKRTVSMVDYLAVRLVLERFYSSRLCLKYWLTEASLPELSKHFRQHSSEFMVRYATYNGSLPEHLLTESRQLIERSRPCAYADNDWQHLAQVIWSWDHSPVNSPGGMQVYNQGWRLFRLAQHLGLNGEVVRQLTPEQLEIIFASLDKLDEEQSGYLWLQAYERNYREDLFRAIIANHNRGTWAKRGGDYGRPEVQVIFCMDEREEGIRRHLEEINPQIETLGAAAFFKAPLNRQVSHDQHHNNSPGRFNRLHQLSRDTLLGNTLAPLLMAPMALAVMVAKSYLPFRFEQWMEKWQKKIDLKPVLRACCAVDDMPDTSNLAAKQQEFTYTEQADIVGGFLTNHSLTHGFGRFVVLMGHYSDSQNNPHQAAYGCCACSGSYSGSSVRAFAAMANQPEVRGILRQRGIDIPDDCWVLGAEHDTCDEYINWGNPDLIPESLQFEFNKFRAELDLACQYSAHERCRKLASAPKRPSLKSALQHIAERAVDYSQARPELGHATNATAFIGRRFLSQGAFWDRRSFLVSYDYSADPDGRILESILLSAGPAGAKINLEYYFSGVSNDCYGAGSKATHNLTGLSGVMEGANSDLRTGLPQQMVEIHEPMRLLIVLESTIEVVTAIYARQPVLQELIGNHWVLLAVKHPDTADIHLFRPDTGFEHWEGSGARFMPTVNQSSDWYEGHYTHLAPALIRGAGEEVAGHA